MKRLFGVVLYVVGGAMAIVTAGAALGALLIIALSQGWQRASLERALEAELSRNLRVPVSIGSLEGPLYPKIVVRNLLVGSPEESLLELKTLELRWVLGQVLPKRRLVIKWARLVGLRAVAEYAGEGSWRVPLPGPWEERAPYLEPEEESGDGWLSAVEVREVSLSKAEILLRSRAGDVTRAVVAKLEADGTNLVLPWQESVGLAPVVRVAVDLVPGQVGDANLDRGELRGTLSEKGKIVVEARLNGDFGEITLDGTGDLGKLQRQEERAEHEITVQLRFNEIAPHVMTGRPELDSRLKGGVTARGSLRSGSWILEEGSILGEGLELRASGAGTGKHLESLKLDFRSDDLAQAWKWVGDAVSVEGTVVGRAELRGLFNRPSGFVDLAGSALVIGGVALGRLDAHLASSKAGTVGIRSLRLDGGEVPFAVDPGALLHYGADGLMIEGLRLVGQGQAVGLNGTITDDGYRDLKVVAEDLDIGKFARLVSVPMAVGGRIDADLSLDGRFRAPGVAGTLEWADPTWGQLDLDRLLVELESRPGRLEATAWAELGERRIMTAEASVPIPEGATETGGWRDWLDKKEARIKLRGEGLDLGILSPFLPTFVRDPGGVARFDLALRGGTPEPTIEGHVSLADGSIRVPVLRQTFAPMTGAMRFAEGSIWLDVLEIGEPGAAGNLSGRVRLEGLHPTQAKFQLDLEGFPLSRSPVFSADVDGQLRVGGSVETPHIGGELALRNARLTVGKKTDPVLKEIRIVARSAESGRGEEFRERAETEPTFFERTSLKLDLEVPADTSIRGEGAALQIEGRAELRKERFKPPRLAGTTNVVRGSYRLQNRRFDVRRGSVSFIGATEIDPVLDVEATHRVRDITVVALITGHASSPTVRLESEPHLPQSEVLSYLVFGRPSNEIGTSNQAGLDSAAAQLAAGVAAAGLGALLSDSLPVETIDVKMQESGELGGFEVGTRITPDLFVRYGTTFGAEPGSDFGIEYRVNRRWSVATNVSTRGEGGGDVFWNFDY